MLLTRSDDGGYGGGELALHGAHVLPLQGHGIETAASRRVGHFLADTQAFETVENCPGLCEWQEHRPIVSDMHHVMRGQRITGLKPGLRGRALGAQTENDAGINVVVGRNDDRVHPERRRVQSGCIGPAVVGQVDSEVGQGQVGD